MHNAGTSNTTRRLSSFTQTGSAAYGSCNFADGFATVEKRQSNDSVAAYVAFKAEIILPAHTKCSVVYSYAQHLERTANASSSDALFSSLFYYYGDSESGGSDKSASETFPCSNSGSGGTPTGGSNFVHILEDRVPNELDFSGELASITYTNTTNSAKTCTAYFGFYVVSQYSGGSVIVGGTSTLTMSEKVTVESVDVKTDKLSDTYKSGGNNFNFYYNKDEINLTSVNFTDTNGVSKQIYGGTGKSPIDAAGLCALNAAGTYAFDFDIKYNAVWEDTGNKSTKRITLTIKKSTSNVTFGFVDEEIGSQSKLYLKDYAALPEIKNAHINPTAGAIAWDAGQIPNKEQNEYTWTFTPDDTNNYETVKGKRTINFVDALPTGISVYLKENSEIYDRYDTNTFTSLDNYLKSFLTVKVKYEDGSESTSPLADSEYEITTTDISVSGEQESKAISVRVTSSDVAIDGFTGSATATVKKAVIRSMSVSVASGASPLVFPVTLDEIKSNYNVYVQWNFAERELRVDGSKVTVALMDGETLKAGTLSFIFTYTDGELSKTSDPVSVNISKGAYDLSGITLTDGTADYDGQAHGIEISGDLPDGVTAEYNYACAENGYNSTEKPVNAGEYLVTVSFTHSNADYNEITLTLTATLTINKIAYPGADKIVFADKTVTFGGEYSIEAENVPEGVTVTYEGNNVSALGEHTVTAKFTHSDPNYNKIADKTATLTITDKKLYDKSGLGIAVNGGDELSLEYTGEAVTIAPTGKVKDADGNDVSNITAVVTVKKGDKEVSEIREAGVYTVTVRYTGTDSEYEPEFELKYTVTVKGEYDLSGITFENATFEYDKEEHSIEIKGELPEGVSVSYAGNGVSEIGEYVITAKFTSENPDYNAIPDLTATLIITKRKVKLVIDQLSSGAGEELAELTATVTEGSILEGDTPYILKCEADKETVGEYPVTWEYEEGFDNYYEITCEDGIYTVTKKADDPNGGGSIDMPVDIDVEFKIIQTETKKEYPQVYGYSGGYYAQLWYRNEDGTLGDEYTDEMNCMLTLKVPSDIIDAICDGDETKEKILEKLKIYCVDGDGDTVLIKNYTLARRDDESWTVKFNYDGKFRAEIVFNAAGIFLEEPSSGSSFPIWILIVVGVGLLLFILLLVLLLRRRSRADDYYDDEYYADDEDDEDDDEDW